MSKGHGFNPCPLSFHPSPPKSGPQSFQDRSESIRAGETAKGPSEGIRRPLALP